MIGSILALVLFSLVINSYVQLNEVYSQISAAESTLNDLQSEKRQNADPARGTSFHSEY